MQSLAADMSTSIDVMEDVDIHDDIATDEFLQHYVRQNRPVLLREKMSDWKALDTWSFEYFSSLGENEIVHLEDGNVMQHETHFHKESFANYMRALVKDADTIDERGGRKPYLSLFNVFESFPELEEHVDFSLLNKHKLRSRTVTWIGPAGTVTGYHIDWGDNLLAQVRGRKCVHLVAPDETHRMYPSRKFDQGTTISEVDLDNYDHERFPKFADARHRRVIIHPGEMLFIPRGWWHHVRSLDKSISVSNITFDLRGLVFDAVPHRIKQYLHNAGLWKCECTCHVIHNGKWVRK